MSQWQYQESSEPLLPPRVVPAQFRPSLPDLPPAHHGLSVAVVATTLLAFVPVVQAAAPSVKTWEPQLVHQFPVERLRDTAAGAECPLFVETVGGGDVFGTTQQAVAASASSGNVTVNFTAAAAGNLLVFLTGRSAASTGYNAPSGWTELNGDRLSPGPNLAGAMFYKIAAGGETSVTSDWTAASGNVSGIVAEFWGPFAASPLDVKAEDESNDATVVTSCASGTTGTTAQADALAIAGWTADSLNNVDGGRSYSNSFTEVTVADSGFGARAASIMAKKVLSATGTQSSTFSTTDTGDEMWGNIAVFKKDVTVTKAPPVYQRRMRFARRSF